MTVLNTALFMVFLFALKSIILYLSEIYNIKLSNRYLVDLVNKLFSSYLDVKWQYFAEQKRGYLIDYILTVSSRNMSLLISLGQAISALLALGVYIVFSLIVSTKLTIAAIGLIIIPMLVYLKILVKIRRYGQKTMQAGNDLSKLVEEYISGSKTLRAYNIADEAKQRVKNTAQVRMKNYIRGYEWRIGFRSSLEFAISFILLSIFVISVHFLGYSLSTMLVVLMFLAKTLQKTNSVQMFGAVATNLPGIQLIEKVYDDLTKNQDVSSLDKTTSLEFKNRLEVKDLNFSYSKYPTTDFNIVLKQISFDIPKGNMCGIVGVSGAGKTALIDIFMGLLKPNEGDIYIDDRPLSHIDPYYWRAIIGYVPQEGFLLNDTIHNNISFYRDIDESDIIEAAGLANCVDFIQGTEQGYKTLVGDNGIKLSGGQRQRICLARALAGKPQVLILDEATSSLDTHSEAIIQEAIEKLRDELTIIVVAHRLSTVINVDQIVVLDKGRIAEIGSPKELLRRNGLFKEMYNKQMQNQIEMKS
jgi:ABC-type multidrug transport system fused ATPase/permease subunit